jgi:DNA repair exonuclease SbcCD nuclease subunit
VVFKSLIAGEQSLILLRNASMTARHFIMTHLFSLIMARLVRGGRLPYSSFVHTLSVNRAFFLPTRVQETRRLIYSKIPRDGAPSSTGTREQRRLSLLTTSSASFQQGDCVETVIKGENIQGIVKQVRGSGWYAIQVLSSGDVIKVRGKQLSLVPPKSTTTNVSTAADRNTVQSKNEASTCVVPPPTIIDLDAALESCKQSSFDPITNKRDLLYLQQCQHHASFKCWIMFTDLHCAPSTIDTCLQVLQRVHAEAVARNAGVLFLGDFWHHRATIRVDLLNNVLQELSSWQVPLIMIPGNHDQVTLGGHNHGLTPLENSFRIDLDNNESNTSVNGPLIFSHPTKFMNALFIPHIRDNTIMESVLSSSAAENATALFVHADVTGAYMNDLIISQGGVSPLCFPPNKPIYSGHFHKPHVVTRKDVSIDYIGSPYETSLAEARQAKSLVVLDASQDWKMIERISLDIGRKHYHATSVEDLLALDRVKEGDRVVVTMAKDDFEQERRQAEPGSVSTIDGKIKSLRNAGAMVEVRELSPLAMGPLVQSNEVVEEMTPQNILAAFLSEEVRREAMKNSTAEELLKAGLSLLEELELFEYSNNAVYSSGNMTNLLLESVSLQGFGSFKDKVTYPLRERGLVLVRGTNKDGGGDRYVPCLLYC